MCPPELGSKKATSSLKHGKYILTHEMRAPRGQRDVFDDLLRSKLQVGILEGGVDDEARESGELGDAHTLLRRIYNAEVNEAFGIGLVDTG